MSVLVLAEHGNAQLDEATARAVSAALGLGNDIHVLVAGKGCHDAARAAARLDGIAKVLVADGESLANQLAESLADVIVALSGNYDAIVAASTSTGKNVMPRVAALLDVMQISDVIGIGGPDLFRRPIYAGNIVQTVRSKDPKRVLTIRASAFRPVGQSEAKPIETVDVSPGSSRSTFVANAVALSERPELTSARIVVSGGRGIGSADNFATVLAPLADTLGAALGASRAAVDAGYVSNDLQVGQTGKIVAPDLYIACGISGAIQHLAGMKDSKVIVAINKDAEAPIFQVADYGLVADLFEAVPELKGTLASAT
ncbi:FAD-binding protein [Ensifer adhaerens]|uniref:electron transfer flavoprotein subunit alpha/FixB family protein n=1 Tax=Ensifer adhaerens TaxID=106592 RepID=UPI001CC0D1E4|nr:FAD-binding protein [Ensifer adhaerens]MBZ7925558.1 FAD-binding protein [Ensifer adhaerens]UAX95288.1 FAD-binding protein [Ensifer adhaerens]UAY02820.1 FAD-binding protein [Ensifer adhaerens]UAY10804.1 FAD-binding protein [Ensifer adhaerens]